MIIIGLTGSIGMGKTTVAAQLRALGAKVCSADDIVHKLLSHNGAAVAGVKKHFPEVVKDDTVDRKALGAIVFKDKQKLHVLEQLLHPLVAAQEIAFARRQKQLGAKAVVLEIPLLFETGADHRCDVVVVASAPAFIQRQRVMGRPNMTAEKFARILTLQVPDREKRARAHAVIETGLGKAYSFREARGLMAWLLEA